MLISTTRLFANQCIPLNPQLGFSKANEKHIAAICNRLLDCVIQEDSNQEVIHCKKKIPNYPKPVHFYIPANINFDKEVQSFVHFHGHNIGRDHFYKTKTPGEGYGDYGDFLSKSKANGVLIIPESDGNCSTYDSFFKSAQNTNAFFKDISSVLKTQASTVNLSGHSGAYRVLNQFAKHINEGSADELKKVQSFGLFDATYGSIEPIEKWMRAKKSTNQKYLFYDSFVSGPKATASKISFELMKKYEANPSKNIIFKPVNDQKEKDSILLHFNVLRDGGLKKFFEASSSVM
jgi:hypothetical protein